MNAQPNALESLNTDSEHLAQITPISSAHTDAGATLSESAEQASDTPVQQLVNVISNIGDSISQEEYKAACTKVFGLMDKYVADGLLVKNEKGKYDPSQDNENDGDTIIATFKVVLQELKNRKPANPKTEGKQQAKPNTNAGVAAKTTSELKSATGQAKKTAGKQPSVDIKTDTAPANKQVSPLAVELDGKTYNTPQEALAYSNRLNGEAEGFRQRYFGLLAQTVEKIDQSIDEALTAISKTDRIATKGDTIGVTDICQPLIDKGIIRLRNGVYEANPDIEKAVELAKAATAKRTAVISKLEKDRKASEERRARREAYDEVLKSENGFWQTFTDEKGKEVVRFAYQIQVSRIPGTTIQQITVKKVAPLFGNVKLQEGSVFTVGGEKTPVFLNKAGKELLKNQQPTAKIADVMPEELGGKKEA